MVSEVVWSALFKGIFWQSVNVYLSICDARIFYVPLQTGQSKLEVLAANFSNYFLSFSPNICVLCSYQDYFS